MPNGLSEGKRSLSVDAVCAETLMQRFLLCDSRSIEDACQALSSFLGGFSSLRSEVANVLASQNRVNRIQALHMVLLELLYTRWGLVDFNARRLSFDSCSR